MTYPSLALWSLWNKLQNHYEPSKLLARIREDLKVTSVEVAGFSGVHPKVFAQMLLDTGLSVCSIHAPSLLPSTVPSTFVEWCVNQRKLFGTNQIVVRTDDARISTSVAQSSSSRAYYDSFLRFVSLALPDLIKEGLHLQLHCFDYDYKPIPGSHQHSAVHFLCDNLPPQHFSIQLDVAWLEAFVTQRQLLSAYPSIEAMRAPLAPLIERIASIHVRTRNDLSVIRDRSKVHVIVECDPSGTSIDDLERVFESFSDSSASKSFRPTSLLAKKAKSITPRSLPDIYSLEIQKALHENICGYDDDTQPTSPTACRYHPLPQSHSVSKVYVSERHEPKETPAACEEIPFTARDAQEQQLSCLFLPGAALTPQLILLVANEGVGKTTFLDYYFGYFLPNYCHHEDYDAITWGSPEEWKSFFGRHFVLRVDVRRVKQNISEVQQLFVSSLLTAARFPSPASAFESYVASEQGKTMLARLTESNDPLAAVKEIASATDRNGRRLLYVTLVFDNADQMPHELYISLLKMISETIPPTLGHEMDIGVIWRVLLPMRNETLAKFEADIRPSCRRERFYLGAAVKSAVIQRRASHLTSEIVKSGKHFENLHPTESNALPAWELHVPEWSADSLRHRFEISDDDAHSGSLMERGSIWSIVDEYCSVSTRRMLLARSRMMSSRTLDRKRAPKERTRYNLLDGMLCGRSKQFNPDGDDECIFADIFCLGCPIDVEGAIPTSHDIWVGYVSVFLLVQRMSWPDCDAFLGKCGFAAESRSRVQSGLQAKGLLRGNGRSEDFVDICALSALLRLMEEEAYVDCCGGRFMRTFFSRRATDCCQISDLSYRAEITAEFFEKLARSLNDVVPKPGQDGLEEWRARGIRNPLLKICSNYLSRLKAIREKDGEGLRHSMGRTEYERFVGSITVVERVLSDTAVSPGDRT